MNDYYKQPFKQPEKTIWIFVILSCIGLSVIGWILWETFMANLYAGNIIDKPRPGTYNMAIGDGAGIKLTTGSYNIFLGATDSEGEITDDFHLYIGKYKWDMTLEQYNNLKEAILDIVGK